MEDLLLGEAAPALGEYASTKERYYFNLKGDGDVGDTSPTKLWALLVALVAVLLLVIVALWGSSAADAGRSQYALGGQRPTPGGHSTP